MAYERFFMPFVNETKGYEFKGRTPAGRCVLESRKGMGKLSVLVQDLKPEVNYGVYLVFAEERRHVGFAMGKFAVNANGKGEFRKDISQESLHNFALAEVVAVAVLDEKAASTASPLCGYKNEAVSWRHSFKIWEKPAPVVPEPAVIEPEPVKNEPVPIVVESEPPEMVEEPVLAEPPELEPPAPFPPLPTTPPRATRPPGAQNPPEKIQPPLATVPQTE